MALTRRSGRRRRPWTEAEERKLRRLYPNTPTSRLARLFARPNCSIYQKAYQLGLRKSAAYLASPAACRLRRGGDVGKAFRFKKGHVPANKGLRRPGWHRGRMKETQFKKGNRPHTWKPVGHRRLIGGYWYEKVSDRRNVVWTVNWKPSHVLLWERLRGRVPAKHVVIFRNGDRDDIRIRNLKCVHRRELAKRNWMYGRLPKPLVETIVAKAQLQRQINQRSRT